MSADRPSSPGGIGAAGSHHELVDLIAEVLDAHEGHWNRDAAMYECLERGDDADRGFRLVTVGDDYQGWLRHVAPLIAERIEKATPPAPFTFGDLAEAARIVEWFRDKTAQTAVESIRLRALANRLVAAADADPNP